jgi:hypothetical protein
VTLDENMEGKEERYDDKEEGKYEGRTKGKEE